MTTDTVPARRPESRDGCRGWPELKGPEFSRTTTSDGPRQGLGACGRAAPTHLTSTAAGHGPGSSNPASSTASPKTALLPVVAPPSTRPIASSASKRRLGSWCRRRAMTGKLPSLRALGDFRRHWRRRGVHQRLERRRDHGHASRHARHARLPDRLAAPGRSRGRSAACVAPGHGRHGCPIGGTTAELNDLNCRRRAPARRGVPRAGDSLQHADLSGTVINANFAGSGSSPFQIPFPTFPTNATQPPDHVEETVLPAEVIGTKYVVAPADLTERHGQGAVHIVRIYGNVDGTTLSYAPSHRPPAASPRPSSPERSWSSDR